MSILTDLKIFVPNYFVRILNILQWLLDLILERVTGYSTRRGWKRDRLAAETTYETSAQVVRETELAILNMSLRIIETQLTSVAIG